MAEVVFLWISYWILFLQGGDQLVNWNIIDFLSASSVRKAIILVFSMIVFLRTGFMLIYLLKRKIPWGEAISVVFGFVFYFIGFSILVLQSNKAIDWFDYLGIGLFLLGSVLNTVSELQRHFWKRHPENMGKLYTGGLFKYSMHINYFGDVLWVSAYAILTRNPYSILYPVLLFLFFAFYNIPLLDSYLKEKYGNDFDLYNKQTKKFIPFIY